MALDFDSEDARAILKVDQILHDFSRRYNVAPSQDVPVIVAGSRIMDMYSWGLIPKWAKDSKIASKLINARAETVAEKPSFREAFKNFRCVVLCSGFFEWDESKQPFYITHKNSKIMVLAGLASFWKDPKTKQTKATCTVITTEANDFMKKLHHRMPVVLDKEKIEGWISPTNKEYEELLGMLRPYSGVLKKAKVSRALNSPKNDYAEVLNPQTRQATL